jgi:chromosome segregation ATPase
VDEHKATAGSNAARLAELEESHASIIRQVEEDSEARALTEKELETHRSLVSNLEKQIEEHKSAIDYHQQGMDSLKESHNAELEKLTTELTGHKASAAALEDDLANAKGEMDNLLKGISTVLGQEMDIGNVQTHIEALIQERKSIKDQMEQAIADLETSRKELSEATVTVGTLKGNLKEFEMINAETLKELEKVSEKERKSTRLVEELEEQLNQNWDQHEMANNRLSALQTERTRELQDAIVHGESLEKEVQESRIKIALLEVRNFETMSFILQMLTFIVTTHGCQAQLSSRFYHRSSRRPSAVELEHLQPAQERSSYLIAISTTCYSSSSPTTWQPPSSADRARSLATKLASPKQRYRSCSASRGSGSSYSHHREASVC